MNEHKVIGYEICYNDSGSTNALVDDIKSFYVFGSEESGKEVIERHKDKKPFFKKIRFNAIVELMDAGDSFTFDKKAWHRFYDIAEENNLSIPEDREMRDGDFITLGIDNQ